MTGVDSAAASLDVARGKPGADRVRWVHGRAADVTAIEVDRALMTGNVARAIVEPDDWDATLRGIRRILIPRRSPRIRDP